MRVKSTAELETENKWSEVGAISSEAFPIPEKSAEGRCSETVDRNVRGSHTTQPSGMSGNSVRRTAGRRRV